MGGPLVMVAVLVGMTHGFRAVGRLAGPRRGGLILGLPSTTAVLLVGSGWERGVGYASDLAESSLLGLAAAVALPLGYLHAVGFGGCWPRALATATAGYLAAAWSVGCLGHEFDGIAPRLGFATAAVLVGWGLVQRTRIRPHGRGCASPSPARAVLLRTLVPVACLVLVLGLRDAVGPRWAGLLSTFPGLTLALLLVTHLEAGPAEACRLARALPPGSLGMVAFLAAFCLLCPTLGLVGATACGYLAAVLALAAVERLTRLPDPSPRSPPAPARAVPPRHPPHRRRDRRPARTRRARPPGLYSPRFEAIA